MAMLIYSNGWWGLTGVAVGKVLSYQRGGDTLRPVPEHLAIFWTILLAQYLINICFMTMTGDRSWISLPNFDQNQS